MGPVLYIVYLAVINCIGAENDTNIINIHCGDGAGRGTNNTVTLDLEFLEHYDTIMTALFDTFEQRLETILQTFINESTTQTECVPKPIDCEAIQTLGNTATDVYTIYPTPGGTGYRVRCDMDTESGGWTVLQRRISDSDFYKTWDEYEDGFGNLKENFWLGNSLIHRITVQGRYELRVDMTSMDDDTAYANYTEFNVGDVESDYTLTVGGYSGNAGDSLTYHNNMKFSTKDRDNDMTARNCAQLYKGGWWYNNCHFSNLNGVYGSTGFADGPVWQHWKGFYDPMKVTEMKIRRIH